MLETTPTRPDGKEPFLEQNSSPTFLVPALFLRNDTTFFAYTCHQRPPKPTPAGHLQRESSSPFPRKQSFYPTGGIRHIRMATSPPPENGARPQSTCAPKAFPSKAAHLSGQRITEALFYLFSKCPLPSFSILFQAETSGTQTYTGSCLSTASNL